ncbi:MAG: hypothetical protein H6650_08840 [Ardenticatenales bacterium]|nr:hypothetical protein [Ardenticatenales bacterium]
MWLVYLRFEDQEQVQTYHVTAENQKIVNEIYHLAEQHGLNPTAKLVEYAFFYAQGTMKPKHVPNFHFYSASEFKARWQKAAGK